MKELDFERNKFEVLTLEELGETYRELNAGVEQAHGLIHYDFINMICELVSKAGCEVEVDTIFAANNKSVYRPGVSRIRDLIPEFGAHSLKVHCLRRVYTTLKTNWEIEAGMPVRIAIAHHQAGIEVGVGPYVDICKNLTILHAEHRFATFQNGTGKRMALTGEGIRFVMDGFGKLLEEREAYNHNMQQDMERLREASFSQEEYYQMVGRLVQDRVLADNKVAARADQEAVYAMTQKQINCVVLNNLNAGYPCNGWEMLQRLNTEYKADRMEIPNILRQNVKLSEFVMCEVNKKLQS